MDLPKAESMKEINGRNREPNIYHSDQTIGYMFLRKREKTGKKSIVVVVYPCTLLNPCQIKKSNMFLHCFKNICAAKIRNPKT
jgi:hypothetical protein